MNITFRGNRHITRIKIYLSTIVFLLVLNTLFGLDSNTEATPSLDRWFKTDPRAKQYSQSQSQIKSIFITASKAELPTWVLMEKLQEGASKHVPSPRLILGLNNELKRLKLAKSIVERYNIPYKDKNELGIKLKHLSLILMGGIEYNTIIQFLNADQKNNYGEEKIFSLFDLLVQIKSINRAITQSELLLLGLSILNSKLKAKSYSPIASIYLRAKASGLRDKTITSTIENVLKHGGGLVQLDYELRQRGNSR